MPIPPSFARQSYFFLACILVCASQQLQAQNTTEYDSTYLNDLGQLGEAKFNYYTKGDKRIKTGAFTFNYLEKDISCPSNLYSEKWEGHYTENLKTDDWEYYAQDFSILVNSVNEESIDYELYEIRKEFDIHYKKGYPDGNISYQADQYRNKQKETKLEQLSIQINDGYVDGEVSYSDDAIEVKGQAVEGLLEGEWTFQSDEEKEIRLYKKGVLTKLIRLNEKDTIIQIDFPLSKGMQAKLAELASEESTSDFQLANAPTSLTFSDGYPRTSKWISVQEKNNELLNRIIDVVFHYDPQKQNEKGLIMGTNRGIYPLSDEEEDLVEAWKEVEFEYRKQLTQLTDSLVAHVSFNEDSTYRIARAWLKTQEELQEQIAPWKNIIEKEQLQFYNRNGLLVDYGKSLLSTDSLKLKDSTLLIHYGFKDSTFLANFVNNLRDRKQVGDSLTEQVYERVKKLNLSAEIESVSAELSQKLDQLNESYEDYPEDYFNGKNIKSIERTHIENNLPEDYRKLINDSELVKQKQMGKSLKGKLILAEAIIDKSYLLHKQAKQLDSIYTETTFDPFTYEKVPNRAKKRLYNVVVKEMVPDLIDGIQPKNQSLSEIHQQLILVEKLQNQLKNYRELDTRKLERSLRRNKALDKRLEIMRVR